MEPKLILGASTFHGPGTVKTAENQRICNSCCQREHSIHFPVTLSPATLSIDIGSDVGNRNISDTRPTSVSSDDAKRPILLKTLENTRISYIRRVPTDYGY